HKRLDNLLQEADVDPQRVAQEVALFADRCDISEEVVRFNSHIAQMRDLLTQSGAIGRQMDFLIQELNREANTMGSKSNDADLTRNVVALKAELEKIREQVQNIE
ncbi:MAG: endoribonuclease YicC domain-containing protein, partial [Desulfuromonadaceae bacterium]